MIQLTYRVNRNRKKIVIENSNLEIRILGDYGYFKRVELRFMVQIFSKINPMEGV